MKHFKSLNAIPWLLTHGSRMKRKRTCADGELLSKHIKRDPTEKVGLQVKVHGPSGEQRIIDLCETVEQMQEMTVMLLKRKIIQQLSINSDLRMVFKSETLEESDLLSSYSIKHMSTIQTLILLPGG